MSCDLCERAEITRAINCHERELAAKAAGVEYECTCGPWPVCTHGPAKDEETSK